ncbi:hypothetical protein GCM10009416_34320 [Craurococcus roseus]|uniref:MAE-28990/MAE-18760-like HEPN domain-containing protein n=1 Tax=Craurococcus roseus TaxID=77585 RepID=A0ABN1FL45_9PROT
MRPFIADFRQRRREVRRYLAVLIRAEREILSRGVGRHDRELNILRAATVLVLYNAVEASARAGIQAIYDEIDVTGTSFDELCEPLRRRVMKDFRANVGVDKAAAMRKVALELVVTSFDASKLFSGNVDARELRNQSGDYGFTITADGRRTRMGEDLVTIKQKRNDLAHGNASFSEVGRDYTAKQLKEIATRSLDYVEAVLTSIDHYLTTSGFRFSAPGAPPPLPPFPT